MSSTRFQADRKPHHLRPRTGLHALFVSELTMCRRGRMDDQAARIADIGEMAEQLDVADQRDAGVIAALEPEREHGARAFRHIALGERVELIAGQPRVVDPGDLVVGGEPGGDRKRVVAMALHAKGSVSMPVSRRKALNGEIAGPKSRKPSTRQAMAKAKLPNVSARVMP